MSYNKSNRSLLGSALSVFSSRESAEPDLEKATFAGGCFWCMEHPFDQLPGVVKVVSGYTGGFTENPTYEAVCSETTGHLEAVEILFDSRKISYESLLDVFWRQIDPTDEGGQFVDRGSQYGTAIFFHNETQEQKARLSRKALNTSGRFPKDIVTKILAAEPFYPAEDYHQNYHQKCPLPYNRYRNASGRDSFLERVWKHDRDDSHANRPTQDHQSFSKPSAQELKENLTPLQYRVTQENGTEKPFNNEYWDNKGEGLYVDLVSGEPLFSSIDKYDSGTGWPSFTKPLNADNILELEDRSLFRTRTEVRSRQGDSHLGHVFDDGPEPSGQRYCINSAALRFIPKDQLAAEGYDQFLSLFQPEMS